MQQIELLKHTDKINELLARYGVKFGIYKNNVFKEQLFPFDSIPRIIEHDEFTFGKGTETACYGFEFIFKRYLWQETDRERWNYSGRFHLCLQRIYGGM